MITPGATGERHARPVAAPGSNHPAPCPPATTAPARGAGRGDPGTAGADAGRALSLVDGAGGGSGTRNALPQRATRGWMSRLSEPG